MIKTNASSSKWIAFAAISTALLMTSCATGVVKRVSDPAASVQQIAVQPNGSWAVDLRLQNYSSIPMSFSGVSLTMTVDNQTAATITASPAITIGPESPDVVKVNVMPTLAGKAAVAESLARRTTLNYKLQGTINATPQGAGSRVFQIRANSSLNPAPGLNGVLR